MHGLGFSIHLVAEAALKPLAMTNKAWARALGEGGLPTLRYGQLLGHAQTLADAGQARCDFMLHPDGSIMTQDCVVVLARTQDVLAFQTSMKYMRIANLGARVPP